jgi:DNA-binding NtrC family response regulator
MDKAGILIIDDDPASQSALREVLGAEGWVVQSITQASQALSELATSNWTLVIANVLTTGFFGPLHTTLKELALAPKDESGKVPVRVLFLVPEAAAAEAAPMLERQHLPFVLKPFNLHDLLEKVSDLLMETEAISAPIRHVRREGNALRRRGRLGARNDPGRDANRNTAMFANREDYEMGEEELAEYERQEAEESQRKDKKKKQSLIG